MADARSAILARAEARCLNATRSHETLQEKRGGEMPFKRNLLAATAVVLCQAGASNAVVLNVSVSGTCTADCSNVGLADGDGIGGSIRVDDAFFAPDKVSGSEALHSYDFAFGNFSFTDTDPPDPGFVVRWGPSQGSVAGFLINGFVSSDPANPGPLLILDALLGGGSAASHNGFRREVPGCCIEIGVIDGATLSVDGFEVAPIPLPAPALLLAGGLVGLLGLRRAGRARRAA
jgi:hypothetical protein